MFVDSDCTHHGVGFGTRLSAESDTLKVKNQRRAKLRAIANNTRNERKRQRIIRYNFGNKKRHRRAKKFKARVNDVVYKAVHAVVDKTAVIAAEDLTTPMSGKKFGKDVNRRLASWTKGLIAKALDDVSQRRGSTLILVNPAYTSQIDFRHGGLIGRRNEDRFRCYDGVVLQADEHAARNIQARFLDPEIDRWMPFKQVKAILLEQTERLRWDCSTRTQVVSHSVGLSTESKVPIFPNVELFPDFLE